MSSLEVEEDLTLGLSMVGGSEEEVGLRSGSAVLLLARMSGQVTGTALQATAVPTTLPAAPAASSVVLSRMSLLPQEAVVDLTLKCLALGVLGWGMAALVVVAGLDGNLEIGFVPGMDATSITLLAEWNVLDAMPQETHTRETKILLIQFLALLPSE